MTQSRKPCAVALVAEDEAVIRMEAADVLADAGFDVFEAGTAQAALSYLDAHPEVSLLVTDIRMPGPVDGLALAHQVCARWPAMSIIVVSGRVVPKTSRVAACGALRREAIPCVRDQTGDVGNRSAKLRPLLG